MLNEVAVKADTKAAKQSTKDKSKIKKASGNGIKKAAVVGAKVAKKAAEEEKK